MWPTETSIPSHHGKWYNIEILDNEVFTGIAENTVLNGSHRSLNIVRVIKSRRLRWAGYVVRMVKVEVL